MNEMFVHLETEQLNIHTNIDNYDINKDRIVLNIHSFVELWIGISKIKYFSLFDDGECVLLIKDGELLKGKMKYLRGEYRLL